MNIIKLNAIDSTNRFLKDLSAIQTIENYTTVVAENQLKGKGQRGSNWVSENGKNLTFSIFINDLKVGTKETFILNCIVPIAIIEVLQKFNLERLAIKWPNDILSENKKIAGILIENTIKPDGRISSIIGIGLNVNQLHFENLPQASSLALLKNKQFDKEQLLKSIIFQMTENVNAVNNKNYFWEKYHSLLFKKDIPSVFNDINNKPFMGIIKGITETGKLVLLLDDDSIKEYDIKEIKMLY